MAVIAANNRATLNGGAVTKTTTTASDTLVYNANTGQILELFNSTGGSLTLVLKGNQATSFNVPGYGTVDVSAGKSFVVAAGATVAINLDNFVKYLAGTSVLATGAAGLTAVLYN